MYYTQNWVDAENSVQRLNRLAPEIVVTGHGRAMQGKQMRQALDALAVGFEQIAVPAHGKYVKQPATVEAGSAYIEKDKV